MMIYAWVEINLFTYMGFFMGVGNAEQGTKITDYIKDFIGASTFKSYLVIVPFIILMLFVWWLFKVYRMKKLEKTVYFIFKRENKLTRTLAILYSLLALTILVCTYYSTLRLSFLQNKHQAIKNTTLFLTSDNSNFMGIPTENIREKINSGIIVYDCKRICHRSWCYHRVW